MRKAILKGWFSISIIILATQISNAFNIEFDDVNSTASVSMSVSVNAGGNSDSDSWQSTEVLCSNGIGAHAYYLGASALADSSVDTTANGASFESDEYPNIFEFCFHQDCRSSPGWLYDGEGNIIAVIPAAFSSTLDATGTVYWKLLPSSQQEKLGMPVIVNFAFPYSIGSNSSNVIYEMGVYSWEVNIGRCTSGPYEVLTYCSPCDGNNTFPEIPLGRWPYAANAVLGDTIKLSYHIKVDGHTEDSGTQSIFWDSSYGDSIRMKFMIDVPPGKEFMVTFDDGPVPGNTENIVNALKNIYVGCEPVKAGFFMVGDDPRFPEELDYYSRFEFWLDKGSVKKNHLIVQDIAKDHLVGNHTQHHACFNIWWARSLLWWLIYGSTKNYVINEIEQCNKEISDANITPLKLFRPPYFVDNQGIRAACSKEELDFQIIMGAGDNLGEASGDTRGLPICPPSLEYVKNNAASLIRRWDRDYPCVLTFHDISPTTANNIAEIIRYLREDEGFTLVHFDPSRLPGSLPSRVQQTTGTIHQSETVTHTVSLDPTVSTATFNVSWKGSDLDLVLYKPDGTKIDSNSTLVDPNIKYAERDTYEYYTISDPNPGNWIMGISGVNVPPEGEKYTVRVEADSNLTLFAFTDKPYYELNEDINIASQLVNDENSVTGALVTAKIQRPDGSVDNLTLYDDGTHGDEDPNDGFYANAYNNTSLRGSYEITISAIGELTGDQYERASSLTVMVGSIIYGNVDFEAYAVFANHWMDENCTEPAWCDTADLDQSGEVDIFDLGVIVEYWLEGTTP